MWKNLIKLYFCEIDVSAETQEKKEKNLFV